MDCRQVAVEFGRTINYEERWNNDEKLTKSNEILLDLVEISSDMVDIHCI